MTSTHNIPRYDKEKKKEEERGKREYCLFVCIMILHTYLVFLFFFFICLTTKQNKKQPFHFFFCFVFFFPFSIYWLVSIVFVCFIVTAISVGEGEERSKKREGESRRCTCKKLLYHWRFVYYFSFFPSRKFSQKCYFSFFFITKCITTLSSCEAPLLYSFFPLNWNLMFISIFFIKHKQKKEIYQGDKNYC